MRDGWDAEPISTYGQAVWRLLSDYGGFDWVEDLTQPMPPEARIVADIFWVSEKHLRRDLRKAAGSI